MERVKGLDAEDLSKTFRPKNVLSEKTCDLCSNLISNLGLVPLWDSYLRDKQDSALLAFAAHPTDTRRFAEFHCKVRLVLVNFLIRCSRHSAMRVWGEGGGAASQVRGGTV